MQTKAKPCKQSTPWQSKGGHGKYRSCRNKPGGRLTRAYGPQVGTRLATTPTEAGPGRAGRARPGQARPSQARPESPDQPRPPQDSPRQCRMPSLPFPCPAKARGATRPRRASQAGQASGVRGAIPIPPPTASTRQSHRAGSPRRPRQALPSPPKPGSPEQTQWGTTLPDNLSLAGITLSAAQGQGQGLASPSRTCRNKPNGASPHPTNPTAHRHTADHTKPRKALPCHAMPGQVTVARPTPAAA
jgi:hypothetical protein